MVELGSGGWVRGDPAFNILAILCNEKPIPIHRHTVTSTIRLFPATTVEVWQRGGLYNKITYQHLFIISVRSYYITDFKKPTYCSIFLQLWDIWFIGTSPVSCIGAETSSNTLHVLAWRLLRPGGTRSRPWANPHGLEQERSEVESHYRDKIRTLDWSSVISKYGPPCHIILRVSFVLVIPFLRSPPLFPPRLSLLCSVWV